ncbi:hypothetical protein [Kitasatospora sp. GAS1066B]|uniref:hypothetical protein n=1 Tax=Kitasatospora sp. GAS1066B TaxID=3156271 RepID=UPI00351668C1
MSTPPEVPDSPAELAPVPEPEPAAEPSAEPVAEPAAEPVADQRPWRRSRTALLLVGALLLGPLLGGGVGYAIQAQRPPTPLPPIQPVTLPSYPAVHLDPQASAAIAPKPLAIDGDLRPLLVPRPAGAQD